MPADPEMKRASRDTTLREALFLSQKNSDRCQNRLTSILVATT